MNEIIGIPYLKEQIIPYIGNKRRLLPLILEAIEKIGFINRNGSKFLDLFSGSGIVSRLAKTLNFEVFSNDWEYYSYIINSSYLCVNNMDLKNLYTQWSGIDGIIDHLNKLPDPNDEEQFIAKYYSPKNDFLADYRKERLFYTRYNGLIIDKIRNEIEILYPEELITKDDKLKIEKYLLLSLLLYQAATHTNTSGVFKAYHKGFGGFSGDALNRILKRVQIVRPVLIDSDYKSHVYMEDANKLVKDGVFSNIRFDIAYIDPPYNQHQYGSNYHLLNTIAKWDKEYIVKQLEDKNHRKKAGIREDWVKTRSLYCYKESAVKLFNDLLQSINSRYILISYNTEGIIPIEQLVDIASDVGRIEIIGNEYIKYRGGKQSIARINNNVEFILIVDKDRKNRNKDTFSVNYDLLKRKLQLQFKKRYSIERLKKHFNFLKKDRLEFQNRGSTIILSTKKYFRFLEEDLNSLIRNIEKNHRNYDILSDLLVALKDSQCRDIPEEIDQIIRILKVEDEQKELLNELPNLLRKIAHKKYKKIFYIYLNKIKSLNSLNLPNFDLLEQKIEKIEYLAEKRFNG